MTSTDYKKIAAVLASTKPTPESHVNLMSYGAAVEQWTKDVRAIVELLHSDNPHFIEDKFLRAAGESSEQGVKL